MGLPGLLSSTRCHSPPNLISASAERTPPSVPFTLSPFRTPCTNPSLPNLAPHQSFSSKSRFQISALVGMAADGRMRRRSRRMREGSKMATARSADVMKPRGGIRCLLKASCGSGSAHQGIPTHAGGSGNVGHVVKPGAIESEVKPSSPDSAEEAWIYVRGCRIKRSGRRFNSQGDVYVPDFEDDESGADLPCPG